MVPNSKVIVLSDGSIINVSPSSNSVLPGFSISFIKTFRIMILSALLSSFRLSKSIIATPSLLPSNSLLSGNETHAAESVNWFDCLFDKNILSSIASVKGLNQVR